MATSPTPPSTDSSSNEKNTKRHKRHQVQIVFAHDTIDLLHEQESASQPLLGHQPNIHRQQQRNDNDDKNHYYNDDDDDDEPFYPNNKTLNTDAYYGTVFTSPTHHERVKKAGRFRFVVAIIIVLAITMNTYANYTLYIASIGMVSNDVLQKGVTELRAWHMSNDPLAVSSNAATPGTCPVNVASNTLWTHPINVLESTANQVLLNASELSAIERAAMHSDTVKLLLDVQARLSSGQLVDWTINERSYIFTAHNLGTILLAVPAGRLGLKYGSSVVVTVCLVIVTLRMLALPTLAGHSPAWVVFVFELIMGGAGSCISIVSYPLAAAWLLPKEANLFVAITQLFVLLGNAATNFISTQLLANNIAWPCCYYLPGAVLVLISLAWLVFGADRPELSRFVSNTELELLQNSLTNRRKLSDHNENDETPSLRTETTWLCVCSPIEMETNTCPARKLIRKPNWLIILTCPTVWALVAVNFAYHWNAKAATLWPTFFANILHMDAATIGFITGLKGVVALVFGAIFIFVTRNLVATRPFGISLTAYRRTNQVLATLILSISVLLMVLLDCNFWPVVASVLLTPAVTSFNTLSFEQMPLDLSAEDSGLLVSVIRTIAIGDVVALPASSFVLSYAPNALAGDRSTWRLVWLLGLGLKTITCLLFMLVAKSTPKSYSRLESAGPCKSALPTSKRTTQVVPSGGYIGY